MSANTRLDSLGDLIRHKANLAVECGCGRRHVLDAVRFHRYALLKCWNTQLFTLRSNLKCIACGKQPARLRATPEPPTPADPFPHDERGWKLLQRRLRG